MTDKEKAKAYDEALERARKMLNMILDNELLGFPDQIREIFPQLCENEDERIRKEIIRIVDIWTDSSPVVNGIPRETLLAYLEKQKPSFKQIHNGVIWDSGLRAGIELEKQQKQKPVEWAELQSEFKNINEAFENGKKEVIDNPEKYGLQKEQKPTRWSYPYGRNETVDMLVSLAECLEMDGNCLFNEHTGKEYGKFLRELARKQVECKSEKWNDSVTKEMFIKALERAVDQTKKGYELTDCDKHSWWEDFKIYSEIKLIEWSAEDSVHLTNAILSAQKEWGSESYTANWLKSLPERFNLQPKQEWSEEDKAMLKDAIAVLCRYNHDDVANFLKSLRPSWKPTKDQIKVLQWCKPLFYDPKLKKILESLIDDLQKLL